VLNEAFRPGQTALSLRVLEELAAGARARRGRPAGGADLLKRLLKDGEPALRPGVLTLAGLWRVEELRPSLESIARAEGAPEATRRAAIEGLADFGAADVLKGLPGAPAAAALARIDLKAGATAAAAILAGDGGSVELLVNAFLSRQGGSDALAAALASAAIPADTAKLALRALSTAGRQDEALRSVLSKAAGISSAAIDYSVEFVKALGQEALAQGDAARGEQVFRGTITNCVSCHAIGGAGGKVGPDVSAVGTGLPMDMVVESVLWPNRQVKEGFMTTAVITKNDQIHQGFHASEDKQTLILRDPAKDELIRIPISDIAKRKEVGSVMPEGLTNGLTRAELRDLIRFLSDLGKPGPFRVPDKALVRRWLVAGGAVRAKSVEDAAAATWLPKFSKVSGELPLEDVGPAGWVRFEVEVLKPGRFQMMFNTSTGLGVWLDGQRNTSAEFDLPAGRHVFTVSVDKSEREGAGLRCQIDPAPRSAAELRILVDR
jgi:putative heme-binding domain-containing protein